MFSSCQLVTALWHTFILDAATQLSGDVSVNDGQQIQQPKSNSFADLGPLKDIERRDLNCAVKEYLLIAGYRLTAMTFYEEVGTLYCFIGFSDDILILLFFRMSSFFLFFGVGVGVG